ncbi:MAG TPA: tetratricopeptide repeat protein [Gemmataceae bacterium]|nr:tetratricopeptide repeat protein [Gemmataceae bacterium]
MDCRRSVVLGLALLGGVLGCSLRKTHSELAPSDALADMRPERELPKRTPRAKTCVEYGRLCESEARSPQRSPAEQEELRDRARKMYQQALQIDPKNLPAALALARLYTSLGDHERAVATYQKALKHHGKDPAVWSELGMCYARRKEWEPALKCLRKAVDLDPENRQAAHNLGYCLARAGRYEESLTCFTKTDGEAKAHYNLARMLHHMRQDDLSREHLWKAIAKDPQLLPAQQLLAELDLASAAPSGTVPAAYEAASPAPSDLPPAVSEVPPVPRPSARTTPETGVPSPRPSARPVPPTNTPALPRTSSPYSSRIN